MKRLPYQDATAGGRAMEDVRRLLERFGCTRTGFEEDTVAGEVTLHFQHEMGHVRFTASYVGWARLFLEANPWTTRRRVTAEEWEARALKQGRVAVWSVIRDWVKAQLTAVETGITTAETVLLPWLVVADDGATLHEALADGRLPALPGPGR